MSTVTVNNQQFDMDVVTNLMDDEIRETLHPVTWDTEQDFVDAYCKAHVAKYGADFVVN